MLDQQDVETWFELPQMGNAAAQKPPAAVGWSRIDESRPAAYGCQCWRCQGGWLALSDRAVLDRILAKHLMRMSDAERAEWMMNWAAQPKHSKADLAQLSAWLRIAGGSGEPEPSYPIYTIPGEA